MGGDEEEEGGEDEGEGEEMGGLEVAEVISEGMSIIGVNNTGKISSGANM